MSDLCKCGCGESAPDGKEFRRGHWSRTPEAKALYAARRKVQGDVNPSGLCMCGCGQPTAIATETRSTDGQVAGQSMRYLPGHHMRGKKGAAHPQWKGGRWTHLSGYVYVYRPEHPAARDGYVLEHRLVLEEKLGRPLETNEHGHHINGVKDDNRPENLVALTKTAHHRLHGTAELRKFHRTNPDKNRENGRKGATARWKKAE